MNDALDYLAAIEAELEIGVDRGYLTLEEGREFRTELARIESGRGDGELTLGDSLAIGQLCTRMRAAADGLRVDEPGFPGFLWGRLLSDDAVGEVALYAAADVRWPRGAKCPLTYSMHLERDGAPQDIIDAFWVAWAEYEATL